MEIPHFILSIKTRPPCLPARQRQIKPNTERRLRLWTSSALGLAPDALLRVGEWVALDSRTIPHVVLFVCEAPRCSVAFVVHKTAEQIAENDVRAAAARSGAIRGKGHAPVRDATP